MEVVKAADAIVIGERTNASGLECKRLQGGLCSLAAVLLYLCQKLSGSLQEPVCSLLAPDQLCSEAVL